MGNPVVHFEIGCRDKVRTKRFYAGLFGWSIEPKGPAEAITTGSQAGINGHITSLGHEPHQYVTFYAEVDDVAAHLEKAERLGGRAMVPETEIPGEGRFAWLADPDGNVVGLWRSAT